MIAMGCLVFALDLPLVTNDRHGSTFLEYDLIHISSISRPYLVHISLIRYLAHRLNELLLSHVRATLPALHQKVSGSLSSARAELRDFGDERLEGRSHQGAFVLQMIHKFCTNYSEALDGTSVMVQDAARGSGELLGGAKINDVFRTQFHEAMRSVDACYGLSEADIARAIRQATGTRTPLFVPEGAFESLARQQIQLLRPHCLKAVELVLAEMVRLLPACLPPPVSRYAALQLRIQACGERSLSRREQKAAEMVSSPRWHCAPVCL